MFFNKLLNLIYPNVCEFCGKKINSNTYTCTNCLSILKYYKERIVNGDYSDYILSLYEYNGLIKNMIWRFKFRNDKQLGKVFAELIANKLEELNIDFDVIIPVPISFSRFLERGYNQCEEITKYISKLTQKESNSKVLLKTKNNKRQSELHINDRKNNVIGVYKVKSKNKIKGKMILLLDDVYTTGATLNECSRVLKNAGASKIIAVTIAYV